VNAYSGEHRLLGPSLRRETRSRVRECIRSLLKGNASVFHTDAHPRRLEFGLQLVVLGEKQFGGRGKHVVEPDVSGGTV